MTTVTGLLLVNQVMPIIAAAIGRGAVKSVGCEDREELVAEGGALAASALESLERRGKMAKPNSVAYYAIKGLQAGKRSYGVGRTDVLAPATALCGRAALTSIDAPAAIGEENDDGTLTLHDALADDRDDPGESAAKHLDWDIAVEGLGEKQRKALDDTAFGIAPSSTADTLGVSRPRVTQLRRECASHVADTWGCEDPIALASAEPSWRSGMRAYAERRAARYERVSR